jgi:ferredoxin
MNGPGFVEYRSRGRLLIAGASDRVAACAERLSPRLQCTLLADDEAASQAGSRSVLSGRMTGIKGHLGHFHVEARLSGEQSLCNLAELLGEPDAAFDLVLDLQSSPVLVHALPPPGYYAPADGAALERALEELPDMIGEFEKPRYFRYDSALCAHGASGKTGCTRCIDVCAARAIRSAGDRIGIDPYLCQGCGACSTACPTGAVSYNHPDRASLSDDLRAHIRAARGAGGPVTMLFLDRPELAPEQDALSVVVAVEDLGCVGMEIWLSALAFGAQRVLLLAAPSLPADSRAELVRQLSYVGPILAALGFSPDCIALVEAADREEAAMHLSRPVGAPAGTGRGPAAFAGQTDKRRQLQLAIRHLYENCGHVADPVELPAGAPFGEIAVNAERCTLCMSCVGICPARALQAGGERPVLSLIEMNCVQCGLCQAACPEDAIALHARLLFDFDSALKPRVLHEERPFCCVECGTAFGTAKLIDTMLGRLQGHWMFRDERARRRLMMCERCRRRDVLSDETIMQRIADAGAERERI